MHFVNGQEAELLLELLVLQDIFVEQLGYSNLWTGKDCQISVRTHFANCR